MGDNRVASSVLVFVIAAANGCVFVMVPEDAETVGSTGGPSEVPESGEPRPITTEGSFGDSESGAGESETATLPEPCDTNVLADPGFEAGTPNPSWIETSLLFNTPLCNGSCSDDDGAEPHGGDWWVWFGGALEHEVASVSQTVSIPEGEAELAFAFAITAAASPVGDDTFTVHVDDVLVFHITDASMPGFTSYQPIVIDVSEFADGGEHTIKLTGETTGAALTNFFVDDAVLTVCAQAVSDASGTSEASGSETEGDATEGTSGEATSTGGGDSEATSTGGGDSEATSTGGETTSTGGGDSEATSTSGGDSEATSASGGDSEATSTSGGDSEAPAEDGAKEGETSTGESEGEASTGAGETATGTSGG